MIGVPRILLGDYLAQSRVMFLANAYLKRSHVCRVASHLFTGSLAGIGKLPALAGWYLVWYVRYFLYCMIWWELHFVKFCGNSPQKGGLVNQKGGRSEGKRGSCRMYDTETYQPSFPVVWVRKIPRKYQPIPNRNTKSGCNSTCLACRR